MKTPPAVRPFQPDRWIATVAEVGATSAKAILGGPTLDSASSHNGHAAGGAVGEFVLIECGQNGIFGRLVSIGLPESDRSSVRSEPGLQLPIHPIAIIQLLATVPLNGDRVPGGITDYPRIGSGVYSIGPELTKWLAEASQTSDTRSKAITLNIASLSLTDSTPVGLTPERLFGRHCAVLGATGSGKSWTLARIIEQTARHKAKVVVFDATGEFHTLTSGVRHVHVGTDTTGDEPSAELVVPYFELTEADLFALFKPSGQSQGPKLRAAMKSLKLLKVLPHLGSDGVILKGGKLKATYERAYAAQSLVVENPRADFDITKITAQIDAECVFFWGGTPYAPDATRWGHANEVERSLCVSLMTRIDDMLQAPELACVFQPGKKRSIFDELNEFVEDPHTRILRISLKYLSFGQDAREIVANAIGRYLLNMSRRGKFRERPVLIALDEAHQFLNKTLGDENSRYPLDSFELIAKEGRKFSLNICIATQRARDIPEGVLSQIGTLVVHRLTSSGDRAIVERACGEIDRSAAVFLPTLTEGQAVIIGVHFPFPLAIQISKPAQPPDARGPNYQERWK